MIPWSSASRCIRRTAVTLIEVIVSSIIVGTLLVAALSTVAASRQSSQATGNRMIGAMLAQELMTEIIAQDYEDPNEAAGSFGKEAGEDYASNRLALNDVDDYHGLEESPPRSRDGASLEGFDSWKWSVSVVWIDATNLTTVRASNTGVKRIQVRVYRNNILVTKLTSLRTNAIAATTKSLLGILDDVLKGLIGGVSGVLGGITGILGGLLSGNAK